MSATRTIGVLFGGRSLEHDVSVVSGLQILHALDPVQFTPVPINIDHAARWWVGDDLWHAESFKNGGHDRSRLTEVTLAPGFGASSLTSVGGLSVGMLNGAGKSVKIDVFVPV